MYCLKTNNKWDNTIFVCSSKSFYYFLCIYWQRSYLSRASPWKKEVYWVQYPIFDMKIAVKVNINSPKFYKKWGMFIQVIIFWHSLIQTSEEGSSMEWLNIVMGRCLTTLWWWKYRKSSQLPLREIVKSGTSSLAASVYIWKSMLNPNSKGRDSQLCIS